MTSRDGHPGRRRVTFWIDEALAERLWELAKAEGNGREVYVERGLQLLFEGRDRGGEGGAPVEGWPT